MPRGAANQRADNAQPDLAARHRADVTGADAKIVRRYAFQSREMLGVGQSPPVERHRGAPPWMRTDDCRPVYPVAVPKFTLRGLKAPAVPGPAIAHARTHNCAAART